MRLKILIVFLLSIATLEARADACTYTFPILTVCTGSAACVVAISADPSGVGKVLRDNVYGTRLGIYFGERSMFDLGDDGRLNFGNEGGFLSLVTDADGNTSCTPYLPGLGLIPFPVDMTPGGSLLFSHNNRFLLNSGNFISLAAGSKIDGRLDIQSEGAVNVAATGDMAMPNLAVDAEKGITVHGQGDIQIGNLTNQGSSSGNQGIHIVGEGDVEIGGVDSESDFEVIADGDITVEEITNADSISLTIRPPNTGVITIGGRKTTVSPVMCSPPDNCDGFELEGGGSGGDSCNTVNSDPNAANNCPGGGATGPGFAWLLLLAFYRRYRLLFRAKKSRQGFATGVHLGLGGLYNAPRHAARSSCGAI